MRIHRGYAWSVGVLLCLLGGVSPAAAQSLLDPPIVSSVEVSGEERGWLKRGSYDVTVEAKAGLLGVKKLTAM